MVRLKTVWMILLLVLLSSCQSWYQKYGISDKAGLSAPSSSASLIQALEDPDANVRRTALSYLAMHESSIQEAEVKLKEMAESDSHRNVKRDAQKLAAQFDKKSVRVEISNCDCQGFSAEVDGKQIHFTTRVYSKVDPQTLKRAEIKSLTRYIPPGYRPLNGDVVQLSFYTFEGSYYVSSITSITPVKNRIMPLGKVRGALGQFNRHGVSYKADPIFPFIPENRAQIFISFKNTPEEEIPPQIIDELDDITLSPGEKLEVSITGQTPGKGSCYVYSMGRVTLLD